MKSPCILLIIVCTLSLTGCASTKQADSDSSLGKAQQTLDSLYQHYSAKDSYLLRESYPFDEQHKVTYLASEDQANMPNPVSYTHLDVYKRQVKMLSYYTISAQQMQYKVRYSHWSKF